MFRDIPCNGDIFRAYFIAYNYRLIKKKTNFLGAILLKWLKENKIKIQKEKSENFSNKNDTYIILNNSLDTTNEFESKLFDMLYAASKDGILQSKEFKKWCSRHSSKILNWFDDVLESQRDNLIIENKITVEKQGKLFKSKTYHINDSMIEEATQLKGLQNFLTEFSLIKERKPVEVTLFEDYLIYAQIFGIANEVAEQFKNLYPDIIEDNNLCYNYNDILVINSFARSGISKANSARSRAQSYSSGGGGFSSGGGRWWLIWWWSEVAEVDNAKQEKELNPFPVFLTKLII